MKPVLEAPAVMPMSEVEKLERAGYLVVYSLECHALRLVTPLPPRPWWKFWA